MLQIRLAQMKKNTKAITYRHAIQFVPLTITSLFSAANTEATKQASTVVTTLSKILTNIPCIYMMNTE